MTPLALGKNPIQFNKKEKELLTWCMSLSTLWTNSRGTLNATLDPSKVYWPTQSLGILSTSSTTAFSFFRDVSISSISAHILRTFIGKKDKNAMLKCLPPTMTEYQNSIKADEGASIITGRQVEITVSESKCCRNVSRNTVCCHSNKRKKKCSPFEFSLFCHYCFGHFVSPYMHMQNKSSSELQWNYSSYFIKLSKNSILYTLT